MGRADSVGRTRIKGEHSMLMKNVSIHLRGLEDHSGRLIMLWKKQKIVPRSHKASFRLRRRNVRPSLRH